MKYHFPIVIIDEDYHSENVSGLGIRDLAQAIEAQGQEVSAVTTFSDLSSLARQASRTSAFIVSLDDDDFSDTGEENEAIAELRAFVHQVRSSNPDVPIFLYGETKTAPSIPNDVLRELHGFIHMFEAPIFVRSSFIPIRSMT